jgi:hypothetical protein
MKLTFTNRKENKNCLYLIRALHEIEKHNLKDTRKPVYVFASKEEMRLAPSLADLHKERLEDGCLITLRADVYNLVFDEATPFKVFLINSSKLLKAFTKNDSRVTLIELRTTNRGITVEYESDNSDVICFLNIEAEEVDTEWPEHPLSTR